MDERVITPDTIRTLDDEELRRLSNVAWYNESLELSWLCQQELIRRKQEQNAERPADPGDDS